MPERSKPNRVMTLFSSAGVLLAVSALALLGCSDKKPASESMPSPAASSSASTSTSTAKEEAAATPASRRSRAVRTDATIERLDDQTIGLRLDDGTSLTVARTIVVTPGAGRQQRREARRLRNGDAKPPVQPAFPALAVGQSHSLTIRYDADGKPLSVRIQRPHARRDATR